MKREFILNSDYSYDKRRGKTLFMYKTSLKISLKKEIYNIPLTSFDPKVLFRKLINFSKPEI